MKGRAFFSSRSAIISLLLEQGELSRADIARQTGLSRPAISVSTLELIDEGLVQEVGTTSTAKGRRPIQLRLGGETKLVVGAAFERGSCFFSLVNLDGQVIDSLDIPHAATADPREVVRVVEAGVRALLESRPVNTLIGCGVSLSGQVNSLENTFSSKVWQFEGVHLGSLMEGALGVPVSVLDNAHAAGLGELWLRGREYREHLVYFYMGIGTGGAIIVGRDLYVGRNHGAGEIGATIVDPKGPDFGCHRGCLEGYVSYSHLRSVVAGRREFGEPTTLPSDLSDDVFVELIAAHAEQGDLVALATMRYAARHVGLVTANLLNLLNPDEVIIGGPLAMWGERFTDMIATVAARTAIPLSASNVRILPGTPVDKSIPLGAAAMIIRQAPNLLAPTLSSVFMNQSS